jgi:signal transduction histidine kinase
LQETPNLLQAFPALFGVLVTGTVVSHLMYDLYVGQTVAQKRLSDAKDQLTEKNKKLEQTQLQLIQQEKLATLGQLAAGLAHEINNPISYVSSDVSALRRMWKPVESALNDSTPVPHGYDPANRHRRRSKQDIVAEVEQLFDDIEEGVQRITGVVGSLLEFARTGVPDQFEEYNINEGIETTLHFARSEYKNFAKIEKQLGEVPRIQCHSGEINQILLNLLTNACHALRSASRSTDTPRAIAFKTYVEGRYVVCEVSNNGPPIPKPHVDSIFEPFFTTKGAGEGTGLGLSIARQVIVNRHGGRLSLVRSDHDWTTFRIELPIRQEPERT